MKKVHLINIGCKVNFAETSRLKDMFLAKGFDVVDIAADSDVILINTCTVTNKADADCRAAIHKARRAAPDGFIGVFGCYAQINSDEISLMPEVNAVFGMKEKFLIPEIISEKFESESKIHCVSDLSNMHFEQAFSADSEARARAFLKIQDGCDYVCTYCTIPKARGNSRSIKFEDIYSNLDELEKSGYKEIVLTGINLGDYSNENYVFDDVLKLFADNKFPFRFRISSLEPNLISPTAIDLITNSETICPHFHIPLQSGSNDVLKLMKRRYNAEKFKDVINQISSKNPNTCIGVDVICGFPGETDDHFEETFRLIDELPISYLHVFTYSERRDTPAATMPGKVQNIKRKERTNRLRELSEKKYNEFCISQIGKTAYFLPETYSKARKAIIGHTENYVKCSVEAESMLGNEIIRIKHLSYSNGKMLSELA